MASLIVACFICSIDFCFQSWYHRWCSDFLVVYLIRSVLHMDTWTTTQYVQLVGMIFLSAVQDFFIYGIFGFRLILIIPFLGGVWYVAQLFRHRLFLLSSLLTVGMIMLQEGEALLFLGMRGTWHECGIRLLYSLLFMLFNDVIHLIKISIIKKP